ncbi:MAG: hypothetical protein WAS72_07060 [Saprospiraceae bacterium]
MNLYPTQFFRVTFIFFATMLFYLCACKKDENNPDTSVPIDYGYTITINSPLENSIYTAGDTLPISILFSSTTGEIVHFIDVEIYSKTSQNNVLYSVLSHQHVPNFFEYNDHFALKDTAKINTSEEWILKAAMWSHEINGDTVSLEKEILIRR